MLYDNHNRKINYLRLAVTDRCNLRCHYCMPEEGIHFAPSKELLSIEELKRLSSLAAGMGIDKIRITGGEPFARKGLMELLHHLSGIDSLKEISITTNATLIGPHIDSLKELGVHSVNVSLDALDPVLFAKITRRDMHSTVMENLIRLIKAEIDVRINCIVLDNHNVDEIVNMLEFARDYPVSVRFLEEMPFNGGSREFNSIRWDHRKILERIRDYYPVIQEVPSPPSSTSKNYRIPGFKGSVGIIPSFSRTFCGSCNRVRITAKGDVITCLYGKPKTNIRDLLRASGEDIEVVQEIKSVLGQREKNGFDAQFSSKGVFQSSMTSIGG